MSADVRGRPSAGDVQYQNKVLGIYLELAQYPILARRIRERMRQELFSKGIIAVETFEAEVKETTKKAMSAAIDELENTPLPPRDKVYRATQNKLTPRLVEQLP